MGNAEVKDIKLKDDSTAKDNDAKNADKADLKNVIGRGLWVINRLDLLMR